MRKGILLKTAALAMAVAMIAVATGCNKQEEVVETQTQILKVAVTSPKRTTLEQKAAFTGKVMPDDSVSVFGKASGEVLKTYFEIGDKVEEGQLLFELDPSDYQIGFEQAKLTYEQALKNLDIAEKGSGDALTELKYKSAVETALNAYETARANFNLFTDDEFSYSQLKKYRKDMRDALAKWESDPNGMHYVDPNDNEKNITNYQAYINAEKKYNEYVDDYDENNLFLAQFESALDAYETALEQYEIYQSMQKGENLESYDISRQQAKLQYDSMLQTMDNLKVYAPISGVIEAKNVSANSMYAPSMAGYVVSNKDIMVVNFAVSSDIVSEMAIGDEVIVENGNQQFKAEITEIGTMVNAQSGLFPIKARFTEAANMLSGVSVKLTAITAKGENCITIPTDALYYDDGDTYVYVYDNGVAKANPITIGIISGDVVEVVEGLSESSQVITSWNANLADGALIEISEEV